MVLIYSMFILLTAAGVLIREWGWWNENAAALIGGNVLATVSAIGTVASFIALVT